MKKILLIFIFINLNNIALGSIKENIINNLNSINNLSFNFEQNINGKTETGNCIIEYPKKILCKYNKSYNKILVSDGKSLVIQTKDGSYYRYGITRTPLNYILDKQFLINQIKNLKERIIDDKFINFTIWKSIKIFTFRSFINNCLTYFDCYRLENSLFILSITFIFFFSTEAFFILK